MNRTEQSVDIAWIVTIEQHQDATIGIRQAMIKLDHHSVGLLPRQEIVMNANLLGRKQPVTHNTDAFFECPPERICHRRTNGMEHDIAC
jgi:hypothetical protein